MREFIPLRLREFWTVGREANAIKSTQAILQLLWEVSRLEDLPKNLVERALGEQLDILTSMTVNRDAMKKVTLHNPKINLDYRVTYLLAD